MKINVKKLQKMINEEVARIVSEGSMSMILNDLWSEIQIAIDDYEDSVSVDIPREPGFGLTTRDANKLIKKLVSKAKTYGNAKGIRVVDWDLGESGPNMSYHEPTDTTYEDDASQMLTIYFEEL